MHAQRSMERGNSDLLIGICLLIYSLHIKKKKYDADVSPFFPYTICPQRLPAKRTDYLCFMCICSCWAKILLCWAQQQECAQRCKESLRPQLLLLITSPVVHIHSTIQSLKIVTHGTTQHLISSLMCHFMDKYAALIALTRNLSFPPLHTPHTGEGETGNLSPLILTQQPTGALNNPLLLFAPFV